MCMYTKRDAYHTSLSHTADYGNPAAKRTCSEMVFFSEKIPQQQTLEYIFLYRRVNQPCHTDGAYKNFPFVENLTLFL